MPTARYRAAVASYDDGIPVKTGIKVIGDEEFAEVVVWGSPAKLVWGIGAFGCLAVQAHCLSASDLRAQPPRTVLPSWRKLCLQPRTPKKTNHNKR